MAGSRIGVIVLLLASMLGTSCATVLRRGGDEIRRQQSGSEPFATAVHSRGSKPWRAIVHTAAYDAADGLVDGALDATNEPQRRAQLQGLGESLQARVGATARTAGEQLVDGMGRALPAIEPVLVEVLEGVRDELQIDPEQTGRKLARGMSRGMREGLVTLGPEVRRLLEEDVLGVFGDALGPGLRERVRSDIRPALDELDVPRLAEDVAKRAALGFSAGMAESLAKDGRLGQVLDDRVAEAKATAGQAKQAVDQWLARGLLIALVLAVVVIVVVVAWWLEERSERVDAVRASRAATEEGERRERMLRLVAGAIKQAGSRDSLAAFREEIKRLTEQESERETAAALNYFLTREGLKLDRPRT